MVTVVRLQHTYLSLTSRHSWILRVYNKTALKKEAGINVIRNKRAESRPKQTASATKNTFWPNINNASLTFVRFTLPVMKLKFFRFLRGSVLVQYTHTRHSDGHCFLDLTTRLRYVPWNFRQTSCFLHKRSRTRSHKPHTWCLMRNCRQSCNRWLEISHRHWNPKGVMVIKGPLPQQIRLTRFCLN